jgi:hypothetical protein
LSRITPPLRRGCLYVISKLADIAEAPGWLLNYSLHKTVQTEKIVTSLPEGKPEVPIMAPSSATPQLNDQFVANLPVSDEIKQMILSPFPKGERSEASMAVLVGLLSANIDEKTILNIYDSYPIGGKAKEAGIKWFEREIENAKQYIAMEIPMHLLSLILSLRWESNTQGQLLRLQCHGRRKQKTFSSTISSTTSG